ncbi:MAG TPA: outer membrane beta-barrel protein [Terracidiphilus sp.]|nr:outer membrane beta-barrel protein [Terracidiphilus sp.]
MKNKIAAGMVAVLAVSFALFARSQAIPADAAQSNMVASDVGSSTAHPSSVAAAQEPRPTVEQEIEMLKRRVDELERELREQRAAALADSADTAAIKAAEKALVAGDGIVPPPPGAAPAPILQAPLPPPQAAPAPAEIGSQTTTRGEPFPGDWTWLNNNGHASDSPWSTKYFTPEFRADANYIVSYNHPKDDTLGGSTESFRSDEWQLEQLSLGGDIRIDNVRGRILTMNGMFGVTTPRNDPSVIRGSWDLTGAYKYISEGWGGYHWDVQHGLNLDAGIFVSYIGLFSYYNFDNWTYQPSFVSSNTPWFFNGLRIQWFPTAKLKIEPWIINGWQSYARANGKPGLGGQILWRPKPYLDFVWNNYGLGEDDPGLPGRSRVHADYSAQVKYYDHPERFFDKAAFTLTGDLGCEYGGGPAGGSYSRTGASPEMGSSSTYSGGVNCHNARLGRPKQSFMGWMAYTRFWFKKDLYAVTLGGGEMNNPGRYLTLLPPINAATAVTGTPYFTENGGDRAQMHDGTITFDYMPSQFITFRLEEGYRYSDVPYWSGRGGITPPGGDNGKPAQYACANGAPSGFGYGSLISAEAACIASGNSNGGTGVNAIWWPDLRRNQAATTAAIMVRF